MNNFIKLLLIFIISTTIISCKKTIEFDSYSNPNELNNISLNLIDPNSISNMRLALANLKNVNISNITITPNNLHVKFSPSTWDDYDSLTLKNRDLMFFNYPLNTFNNNESQDLPNYSETPNDIYTVVNTSFEFPSNIPFEIIDSLYFPEEDSNLRNLTSSQLLELSEIAENIANPELVESENSIFGNSSWTPGGNIKVHDDEVYIIEQGPLIPLRGVQIRARRWTKIVTTLTQDNGDFRFTRKFARPVNYSMFYQRKDFDLREGYFGQIYYNGPKIKSNWDLEIESNPHKFYSHIFQASVDYFYSFRNNFNLGPPPLNSWLRPALKIGAFNWSNVTPSGDCAMWARTLGILTQIRIFKPNNRSSEIYSTTIHELGHSAHWWLDQSSYNNCENKVSESWGRGIQWIMTNYRYKMLGEHYNQPFAFNFNNGYQFLNKFNTGYYENMRIGYTPLVIDLMDNENQYEINNLNHYFVNDKVTGFTISEIFYTLRNSRSLQEWRDALISLNKAPSNDIQELFNFYISIK